VTFFGEFGLALLVEFDEGVAASRHFFVNDASSLGLANFGGDLTQVSSVRAQTAARGTALTFFDNFLRAKEFIICLVAGFVNLADRRSRSGFDILLRINTKTVVGRSAFFLGFDHHSGTVSGLVQNDAGFVLLARSLEGRRQLRGHSAPTALRVLADAQVVQRSDASRHPITFDAVLAV